MKLKSKRRKKSADKPHPVYMCECAALWKLPWKCSAFPEWRHGDGAVSMHDRPDEIDDDETEPPSCISMDYIARATADRATGPAIAGRAGCLCSVLTGCCGVVGIMETEYLDLALLLPETTATVASEQRQPSDHYRTALIRSPSRRSLLCWSARHPIVRLAWSPQE